MILHLLFYCVLYLSVVGEPQRKIALLIIDVQNCFLPGGSLAVTEGDEIIPVINQIRRNFDSKFSLVVVSQDWHCSDHISFASQHQNANPFEYIQLSYDNTGSLCSPSHNCSEVTYNLTQRLWPDHCVINTTSSELSTNLTRLSSDIILKKGYDCQVDSYSVFFDNGKFQQTELNKKLMKAGIDTVFVTGLARDYCVYYSAVDAKILGYETYVVYDATRPVGKLTGEATVTDMKKKEIHIINSTDMASIIQGLTSVANNNNKSSILILCGLIIFLCSLF